MQREIGPTVTVNLSRICTAAEEIAARTGVPVIAVVKANAYGLGACRVARALADLPQVEGFYTLTLAEALAYELPSTGKPPLALDPPPSSAPDAYLLHKVRPSVWSADVAAALRKARPVLSVDTGMQRFAAPASEVGAVLDAGDITEAMTHATRLEHVLQLQQAVGQRPLKLHTAGSALLDEPRAYLHATRPGVALYRTALTVTAPLYQVRDASGPAGYTGFVAARHGLILAGYQHGLRVGPCLVNGRTSRLLEVGMQTSFVELEPGDHVGDPVTLVSPDLPPETIAAAWGCGPHEVLLRLSAGAPIRYVD